MPEISRFFGIVITMYKESSGQHHRPHFHARYAGKQASFGIDPVELIAGSLPKKEQRFVEAWAELHADELKKDWKLLEEGILPQPITPLQ
jgi:Domain of unknown function (DUF4160)